MKLLLAAIIWLSVLYAAWGSSGVIFCLSILLIWLAISFAIRPRSLADEQDERDREMDRYFDEAREHAGGK